MISFSSLPSALRPPIELWFNGLSATYCDKIGLGCTIPGIRLAIDPKLRYAHSVTDQAYSLATLTRGLTYITHPAQAPLSSDAIAKMSIHINMGSSSPAKLDAVKKLDYFEKACRKVEDELYEAAGILSTRIDFIIEGISHLHMMLNNKKYTTAQIEEAHQKFLPILEGHLEAIGAGLKPVSANKHSTVLGN
jgi:hypothetical protein